MLGMSWEGHGRRREDALSTEHGDISTSSCEPGWRPRAGYGPVGSCWSRRGFLWAWPDCFVHWDISGLPGELKGQWNRWAFTVPHTRCLCSLQQWVLQEPSKTARKMLVDKSMLWPPWEIAEQPAQKQDCRDRLGDRQTNSMLGWYRQTGSVLSSCLICILANSLQSVDEAEISGWNRKPVSRSDFCFPCLHV